jgi:hypothetical protein
MRHNQTWVREYSKTELANRINRTDHRLELAIRALELIRDEAEALDSADTLRILNIAKLTLDRMGAK